MKKIILLVFVMILMTGCSANVNVTITPSGIEESISISAYSDRSTSKKQVYDSFRKYVPVYASTPLSDTEPDTKKNGIEYYIRTEKDLGSGYMFTYNYKYKLENYKNSRTMQQGFDSRTIQKDTVDKNIMISTDSGGLNFFNQYPDLESVTINVRTSYKVKQSNADRVNGNTYTWILRKGTKKSIYLLLDDPNGSSSKPTTPEDDKKDDKDPIVIEKDEKEESEIVKFLNEYPLLVALGGILIFFMVLFIISNASKMKN